MHSTRPECVPPPVQDEEAHRDVTALSDEESKGLFAPPVSRPFIERRRYRAIENSWQEAIDCLQRHLVGFEADKVQLRQSEVEYKAIFEEALVGIFQINPEGRFLRINRTMAQILGYESPEQLLSQDFQRDCPIMIDTMGWEEWKASDREGIVRFGIEVEVRCPNGQSKWVSLNVRAVLDRNKIVRFEGTGEDITAWKLVEVRKHFLAYHDQLTGLANRSLFDEELNRVIGIARKRECEAAVLLLGIERFKVFNDSLGDSFGDRLLKEIAERITETAGKRSIVARVAGAKFAVILPDVDDACQVRAVAESLLAALDADFVFLGHSLKICIHGGISMFPQHGEDVETLMKNAGVAMCSAREDGSSKLQFFTEQMNAQLLERMRLENDLHLALIRRELFLMYQPQVDLRTGEVTGLEALLRWQHPEMGLIPPNKFIGIAETSGLIIPIGEWVLRTACSQARRWQDEGLPAVSVAVNVSALQFRQQGFRDLIRSVLEDSGLNPKYLELELTESLLLTNADVMFSIIQELKEMGIRLAIDDFGTGYSSLGYLRQFKVNRLKISRSFVQDIPANSDDATITAAIIRMAQALNLTVLAEGVENEAQLTFLRAKKCYTIQGFYFSKPLAEDQIAQYLRKGFDQHVLAGL
ncbi:MAG: EAL domain-containing protein [Terracidiphilus sp.]